VYEIIYDLFEETCAYISRNYLTNTQIIDVFSETCSLKQHLPFGDGTFDLVRMSCLALCITSDSWGFILEEVYRVLVTGGRLEFIDDQMFFPYGRASSLMDVDDANSVIVESYAPRVDSVLSPTISTYSIYGDVCANPGLGSTVGYRGSDDDDDGSDLDGGGVVLDDHKGKVTAKPSTAQPRVIPSIVLSPEDWERSLSISDGLEALFGHMLLDTFDIHKDPSDFILSIMREVFGQAREMETMNLVLAPPDFTAKLGRSPQPQQGLSHCPGLILWPSTFIPMDHTEVEIHASKHLRTLLSCKNFLAQHAIEVAEDERVDEEFVSEALWEYERFVGSIF
jgi:Methyltransferase domain